MRQSHRRRVGESTPGRMEGMPKKRRRRDGSVKTGERESGELARAPFLASVIARAIATHLESTCLYPTNPSSISMYYHKDHGSIMVDD